MKSISLVIPVFNEEKSIVPNLRTIQSTLPNQEALSFEIIVVDDGSIDKTGETVATSFKTESSIKLYSFTRNFGKEAAILAGLSKAKGDAVIVMDSDLQHPPQLIGPMIDYWQRGFKVVEAVKESRGKESLISKLGATMFYYLMTRLSGFSLAGHSDFKLLDREVVDAYLELPEKQRFFRGIIHWLGYVSVQLPFTVPERQGAGGSRWSRLKLIKYAIKNITIFSSIPLSLVSLLGVSTLLVGVIFGAISLWQKLQGIALSGFTTVNLLVVIMGGAILMCLGILGHYLALIYDEIKGRPPFVIGKTKDK